MTFYKELKKADADGAIVTAWEVWEKYSTIPHYEVTVVKEQMECERYRTARTTWRRKFNEVVNDWKGW